MKSKRFEKPWWMVLFVMVLLWTSFAYAGEVNVIINAFLEKYEKEGSTTANKLLEENGKKNLKILIGGLQSAIEYLGKEITGEKSERRKGAAEALLKILSELKDINASKKEHQGTFERLNKDLVKAYKLGDSKLQGKVEEIWKKMENSLSDSLETSKAKKPPKIPFDTRYFYLHSGGVLLNPYTIKKNDAGKFMLEQSGKTDATVFVEAVYRNRYAWLDKEPKSDKLRSQKKEETFGDKLDRLFYMMDYEMKLGWASTDDDPSGAVVSGAGDAYMEFSVGRLILYDLSPKEANDVSWSFNIEGLTGLVTDKGAQDIHCYGGVGPVISVGIPNENNRKFEILGGVYFGEADKPQFIDNDTREIDSKNDLPKFSHESVAIWRGDIHVPFGDNGFLTVTGRFYLNLEGEDINPWSLALGYTIPVEPILSSISSFVKQ